MNEFMIISKGVFEEMVGKFSRFSDRVNEILGKREEGQAERTGISCFYLGWLRLYCWRLLSGWVYLLRSSGQNWQHTNMQ